MELKIKISGPLHERLCFIARRDQVTIDKVIQNAIENAANEPDVNKFINKLIDEQYKLLFCHEYETDVTSKN